MPKTFYYVFLTVVICFINSCGLFTKLDDRINNYVNFIESNANNMTATDWKDSDLKIESFQKELQESKMDMTEKQIQNANQALGKYAGLRLKKGIGDFKETIKEIGNQMEGFIEELSSDTIK